MRKRKLRKEAVVAILLMVAAVTLVILFIQRGAPRAGRKGPTSAKVVQTCHETGAGQSQKTKAQKPAAADSTGPDSTGAGSCAVDNAQTRNLTVILDPGHGGPDAGATGVGGIQEKKLNLTIAKKLQTTLREKGFSIIMTREDDRSIYDKGCVTLAEMKNSDLNNRIKIMEDYPGALFVSIHQNYNPNSSYRGTQVYYSNTAGSSKMAKLIQAEVKKDLEPDNTRAVQPPGKLRVLLKAPIPAVMIECGFISNNEDAADLESGDYQDHFVSAIAQALCDYVSSV